LTRKESKPILPSTIVNTVQTVSLFGSVVVTRLGAPSPDDQLIETTPTTPEHPLFRIAGVEPYGWSTVLLEDDSGRWYVAVSASGRWSEISSDEADDLFRTRTYREWHGDRSWSPFERLPLLGGGLPQSPPTASDSVDSTT